MFPQMTGFNPAAGFAMQQHQSQQQRSSKDLPTLYIADLSRDVYNLDLYKFFDSKGFKVYKAKVSLDKKTNQSKGCGYAIFNHQEEAQRALDTLNYTKLKGKEVRMMWASREKKPQEANLYVRRIAPEFNQSDLQSYFQQFGTVLSCKIEKWQDGTSRGFGYLQYEEEEKAVNAINQANGAELTKTVTDPNGTQRTVTCKIEVSSFKKKEERNEVEQPFTNLYVKNLPKNCNEEMLKSLFQRFGEIESVHIQKDPQGALLDYGFIDFKDTSSAHQAMKEMDKYVIEEGKVLYVSRHLSKKEMELQQTKPNSDFKMQQKTHNNSNLYVTGLPEDLTEERFMEVFSKIGKFTF